MGSCWARSVYLTTLLLGRLSSKQLTSIVHILLPKTDNCPSWISGRERITEENISWSNLHERMLRTRWGRTCNLLIISRTSVQLSHRGRQITACIHMWGREYNAVRATSIIQSPRDQTETVLFELLRFWIIEGWNAYIYSSRDFKMILNYWEVWIIGVWIIEVLLYFRRTNTQPTTC